MIYFVQCAPNGPVKIGFTSAYVASRVKALQAASPHELVFLGAHEGDADVERALHTRFADYRVRGEWFHPVRPVLAYIRSHAEERDMDWLMREDLRRTVWIGNRKNWPKETKKAFYERFKAPSRFCQEIHMWTGGGRAPSPDLVCAVEAFFDEHGINIAETV